MVVTSLLLLLQMKQATQVMNHQAVTVTVQTTSTTTNATSISLQLSANKATPSAGFTASGKLIDAITDSPIGGQANCNN